MKLRTEITIFVVLILIFSLGSITILSYQQMKNIFNDQLEDKLLNIAIYTSENYLVKEALLGNTNISNKNINEHIEKIRLETDVDFIVVFDMDGVRLTHPNENNIGKKFEGGDEVRVLTKAEQYISEAKGTLGTSIRAFAPIFDSEKQIGAVSVGSTIAVIKEETNKKMEQFIPFLIVGSLLGICFAYILASNIKEQILGLEPKEIALLLKEKEAILENVKEGIITLNEKGNLIQYNKEAARILGLTAANMSLNINEIIRNDLLKNIGDEDIEVKIRPGVTILYKYNLLKNDKNEVIGQVINFRDLTEVKIMAEELTGIKKMAWSLRAHNHEFMNKLHTISGLIQLEEYDEAIKYISKTANTRNEITEIITGRIKNLSIAGLLLAKYYKAEELRINLEVDKNSGLENIPASTSEDDLGSVIGNLIENSLEAVNVDGTGRVYVKVSENNNFLYIVIKDNGPGIPAELADKIYNSNFSTKASQRGYGMFIVKNIIESANGKISLSVDEGTLWNIEIPMKSGENL